MNAIDRPKHHDGQRWGDVLRLLQSLHYLDPEMQPETAPRRATEQHPDTGSLTGIVIDDDHWPLRAWGRVQSSDGVLVKEFCHETIRAPGDIRWFEVHDLPAGVYRLEIVAPGFQLEVREKVKVEAGRITRMGLIQLRRIKSLPIHDPHARQR